MHNDTKISNVLFDAVDGSVGGVGEALCVVDLDTVMGGSVVFDFGDMARSICSRCEALPFHCPFTAFQCPSLDLPLPSTAFHCPLTARSLPFHRLSLPFQCPFTIRPPPFIAVLLAMQAPRMDSRQMGQSRWHKHSL